ncbi:efflux RND transporter permease subunit [Magnetovirga frankeli]|uniref:efflux RND transporter permease subunit n=1 Tax=Magnetovirga frankeli TaxID=947516 RepID=UPI0012935008|nr:efflux RND transporter permease subunit [gamma proteobacterium SS-5]
MIRWFASHPTAANLLLLLLLAIGLFSAPQLRRETFPDYRPTEFSIELRYPGASAADVEDSLCRRLQDALQGVENLKELRCTAQDNLASAVAKMRPGGDVLRFRADLDTEVKALRDLPARVEEPILRQLHRNDLVAAVALSGDLPLRQLENQGLRLQDRLQRLPGVSEVVIRGLAERQWQIAVQREQLAQHGLSPRDLALRLRRQNLDLPLGILERPEGELLLRFTDQSRSLDELARRVVHSSPDGGELTLGQIARLSEVSSLPEEQIWFNGRPALVLEVSKGLQADALTVMELLQGFVASESRRQPDGLRLQITQDMTGIVRDRLQMLVSNGFQGLLLVVAVMSLFFRPRLALWAVFGLPAAFFGAFAVMALTGLSLNMITLVALLMAIGIVMDDAVVITDNIAAHGDEQPSPLEAVTQGAQQVFPGVLSSFLTTAAVFLPLSFLAGELGAVLQVLPVVLIAALAASLIEAFWILPHHLKGSLQSGQPSRFRLAFERGFEGFKGRVGRFTDAAIRQRHLVLGLMLAFLLGSVSLLAGGHIGQEAMPDIDGDVLEARVLLPQGTPLARTEAVARQIEQALQRLNQELSPQQPQGQALVKAVQVRFNQNLSAREAGPHVVTLIADLLSAEQRSISLDQLSSAWREAIGPLPGVRSLIIQEPGFGPAGIPIELRLQGEDLDQLRGAADALGTHVASYVGVYNQIDDLRPSRPEYRLSLSPGAHALGLDAEELAGQLRAAILGEEVETYRVGDWDIELRVRHALEDRDSLADLAHLSLKLANGQRVPLSEVARIEQTQGWASITRIDDRRTLTLEANLDPKIANAQQVVAAIQQHWQKALAQDFPGVRLGIEGQVARSGETGASIKRGLIMGLIGVFLILSFQFRSYLEPIAVMLSIPFALVGALWGHLIMGYYLSMPSLIGAASLAGIVVNNAILLIQFIKQHRDRGLPIIEAAGQASRDRLRAIVISSSTTILGLAPLLAESSTQAAAIKPLVISVVFGLLVATVLVLIALPALYVLMDDWGWTNQKTGDRGQGAED